MRDDLCADVARRAHERDGPGVLVHDQRGHRARLERVGGLGDVVVAEQPRACAREGDEATEVVGGEVFDVDARERAVVVFAHDEQVEDADDPTLDQVEQRGRRLPGHVLLAPLDDEQVDRSEDVVDVGRGHGLLSSREGCVRFDGDSGRRRQESRAEQAARKARAELARGIRTRGSRRSARSRT